MIISQDRGEGRYQIRSYEPGTLKINEELYHQSLIITPQQLIRWEPRTLAQLTLESWLPIIDLQPELVLVGTGANFYLIKAATLAPLYEHKLGVECMDTRAACRTYMALMAENRNVAAALLIE